LPKKKDDDGRYPIHWAVSANNYDIVLLLANQKDFDPDVQVGINRYMKDCDKVLIFPLRMVVAGHP
jgi:ankyrin repeat protein